METLQKTSPETPSYSIKLLEEILAEPNSKIIFMQAPEKKKGYIEYIEKIKEISKPNLLDFQVLDLLEKQEDLKELESLQLERDKRYLLLLTLPQFEKLDKAKLKNFFDTLLLPKNTFQDEQDEEIYDTFEYIEKSLLNIKIKREQIKTKQNSESVNSVNTVNSVNSVNIIVFCEDSKGLFQVYKNIFSTSVQICAL